MSVSSLGSLDERIGVKALRPSHGIGHSSQTSVTDFTVRQRTKEKRVSNVDLTPICPLPPLFLHLISIISYQNLLSLAAGLEGNVVSRNGVG